MSFTITLMRSESEGSMTNWRCDLPRQFNLDESYCVALKEISFTDSFYNITKDYYTFAFDEGGRSYKSKLSAGRYESIASILNVINGNVSHFQTWEGKPLLVLKAGKVIVDPGTSGNYYLEPGLASFLGYKNPKVPDRLSFDTKSSSSNSSSDNYYLHGHTHHLRDKVNPLRSLLVYLDITDYTIVGDSFSNLLRVVEIPSDSLYGDQVVQQFKCPEFVKLSNHSFSSIQTLIKDTSGEDIRFRFGTIILTLLFKPSRLSVMSMLSFERDEFRIILPSNTTNQGKTLHHQNTLTHWKTILPQTLNLSGEYEVGLTEISYTYSWYNINYDVDCKLVDQDGVVVINTFRLLNRGQYKDIFRLTNEINTNLKQIKHEVISTTPQFAVHKFTQRVRIIPGSTSYKKLLYPITSLTTNSDIVQRDATSITRPFMNMIDHQNDRNLYTMEGASTNGQISEEMIAFHKQVISSIKDEQTFSDWTSNIRSIFVHTNIIEHTVIGDKFGQLLRTVTVPIQAEPNDQITFEDPDPIFHPLISNQISIIDIHLKDEKGNDINFQDFGESRVTLLFRRRLQ